MSNVIPLKPQAPTKEDELRQALKDCEDGKHDGHKMLLMFLDEADGKYDTVWRANGFGKTSEIISMLEVFKSSRIKDMEL